MTNDFQQACRYLFALGNEVAAMKLGLENITRLLDELGNPQSRYFKVQVAGTNGKGSVCAFLGSICTAAQIPTGVYTSPHLVKITERIKIEGRDITEEQFAIAACRIREVAEDLFAAGQLEYRPTYFEQVTAIALSEFAESGVELAILETGLGGRYDATTAAHAEIAAITRVDLDHQHYLGDTVEKIAGEKAAIIRPDSKAVIIGQQSDEALKVIVEKCRNAGIAPRLAAEIDAIERGGELLFPAISANPINIALKGRHQVENAKTAIATAIELSRFFSITNEAIVAGLENARHPGRIEIVGRFLLDGAHNTGGMRALCDFLEEKGIRGLTVVFAAMRDKNIAELIEILAPYAKKFIVTAAKNERSLPADEIGRKATSFLSKSKIITTENVRQALRAATENTAENDIILVTGSLYLIGEVKSLLESEAATL